LFCIQHGTYWMSMCCDLCLYCQYAMMAINIYKHTREQNCSVARHAYAEKGHSVRERERERDSVSQSRERGRGRLHTHIHTNTHTHTHHDTSQDTPAKVSAFDYPNYRVFVGLLCLAHRVRSQACCWFCITRRSVTRTQN
jgi:hypothetical protein